MPTHEAVVSTAAPKAIEKPIPTRTVSTRSTPRNVNQHPKGVDAQAAESAPAAESVRLSPQLTALARKEQAYRQREQALKEREKALEAKLADADQYSQLKTKFAAKDYSAAEELGMSYDEHTKYLLDKQAGEDPESERYNALETKIQALEKSQEDKANQEYEEQLAVYKSELSKMVESAPEFTRVKKYADVDEKGKEFTGIDVALEYIVSEFNDGREVALDEALRITDGYLKERAQKWKALDDEPAEVVPEPKALPPPRTGRTLTQQMQPSGETKVPQKSLMHLPEEERYAEARRRVIARQQQGG